MVRQKLPTSEPFKQDYGMKHVHVFFSRQMLLNKAPSPVGSSVTRSQIRALVSLVGHVFLHRFKLEQQASFNATKGKGHLHMVQEWPNNNQLQWHTSRFDLPQFWQASWSIWKSMRLLHRSLWQDQSSQGVPGVTLECIPHGLVPGQVALLEGVGWSQRDG